MKKILLLAALVFLPIVSARADGEPSAENQHIDTRTGAEKVGADAAVADDRLPPVFPGEEVRDGNNKIKTWSTSGPIHVGRAPEPWRDETNSGLRLR